MKTLTLLTIVLLVVGCTKTVVQTEPVIHNTTDTMTLHDTLPQYLVPTDTNLIYLAYDTGPGFQLDSICVQDINTDGVCTYRPEYQNGAWCIHVPTPMLTTITFY